MNPPPTRVGDRYRLDEPIARGGMAVVYRGHDDQLGRPVAIKIMRADLGEDRRFLRRFEAEARRAASVSHPNLVAVYDVGTDGAPYIVMELVEGGDLAAALRREGPMDPERVASIGSDVAAALEVAHGAGLVHRDIKPGNILLGTDGRPRVADFGIARATGEESLTRTGAMLGSVEYFSPEQARGERATAASDIYALGVVLYELLTGRRPFGGDTPYAVATARLRGPVPDPREVKPDVPAELAGIVRRAMALEAGDRFTTATQLREELDAWRARGRSAVASSAPEPRTDILPAAVAGPAPVRAAGHSARDDRRSRTPWLAAAALVLLLVGGYAGARLIDAWPGAPAIADPLEIVVGTPGGEAGQATASPVPAQTGPAVTATPAPPPTSAPQASAPPAPPSTPQPATPAPVALAGAPDDAVAAFYRAVVREDFDAAYALWSDRMKAVYDRQENLDDRFAETADITFSQLSVASQSATQATVQANFAERYESGSTRQFIGYWRLVRVDGTWLLDEPNY